MSVSVRVRFEVFKRDGFKCSYCGRTAAHGAQLEVDHVLPLAAGGTDDIENLTTSCWDCNHGKAAKLLEEGTGPAVDQSAVDRAKQRVERQRQYAELMAAERALLEQHRWLVLIGWMRAFDGYEQDGKLYLDTGNWPNETSLEAILRRLPVDRVLHKIELTRRKFGGASLDACRYFYGCCWRAIKDEKLEPVALAAKPSATTASESYGREDELEDELERLKRENAVLRDRLIDPDKLRNAAPERIGTILQRAVAS